MKKCDGNRHIPQCPQLIVDSLCCEVGGGGGLLLVATTWQHTGREDGLGQSFAMTWQHVFCPICQNHYFWWLWSECSPLPIPNREVKPSIADDTALVCGKVGRRQSF